MQAVLSPSCIFSISPFYHHTTKKTKLPVVALLSVVCLEVQTHRSMIIIVEKEKETKSNKISCVIKNILSTQSGWSDGWNERTNGKKIESRHTTRTKSTACRIAISVRKKNDERDSSVFSLFGNSKLHHGSLSFLKLMIYWKFFHEWVTKVVITLKIREYFA